MVTSTAESLIFLWLHLVEIVGVCSIRLPVDLSNEFISIMYGMAHV